MTIYPKVSISGGPPKEIMARVGTSIPSYSNYAVSGIVNTATYELLSDDTPVNISTICPGLTFSDKTGMISGTPTALCVKALAVRVTDAFDGSSATSTPFSIVAPLALAGTPDRFIYNEPYSFDLSRLTSGGKKPYTYKLTSGSLPHGLTLTSSGTVSGTPTSSAASIMPTITVSDTNGYNISGVLPFNISRSNAFSWGDNTYWKLGLGNEISGYGNPAQIVGRSTYIQLAAGETHSCGLVNDGTVQCWGYSNKGQLGVEGISFSRFPITVPGITGASAITVGAYHSCAIVSGAVKCWGYNGDGQLGDGSTTHRAVPVQVSGLTSDVTAISAGYHNTCAVVSGAAKCWGRNGDGQLGDGSSKFSANPVQVIGLDSGVTGVSGGGYYSCAVVSGAAKCWGDNSYGQLGDGSTTRSNVPVQVSGLTSDVTVISAGVNHTCATISGAAKCWGDNLWGQLGNDRKGVNSSVPVQVSGLTSGVTMISAGKSENTCAIVSGAAMCWGQNARQQLGNNFYNKGSDVPVQVYGLTSGITEIVVGREYTLAR